jgi:hypothetical protein
VQLITIKVEVTRLDFSTTGGTWDALTGTFPDVYAVFRRRGETGGTQTQVSQNVSSVPVFLTGAFAEFPNSNEYEVLFYDSDANDILAGEDDYIGGYRFLLPTGRQESMTLNVDGEKVAAKLHFTYQ